MYDFIPYYSSGTEFLKIIYLRPLIILNALPTHVFTKTEDNPTIGLCIYTDLFSEAFENECVSVLLSNVFYKNNASKSLIINLQCS